MQTETKQKLYGVMAEFDSPTELVNAARQVRDAGFTKTDAYSPFPIHEIDEALGIKRTILPYIVFTGGVIGLLGGFALQYLTIAVDYPINVAGRPYLSLPSYIPVIFECTVLVAAFTAGIAMLLMNGLPQPYHPVFNAPRFALATREKFFLAIEATDPKFDYEKTKSFLAGLSTQEVVDVEQ